MVVNHNIPALSTYNVINSTSNALQKSINKLSTGLRINSAADDAAGLAISEKMRAQVRGLDQAVANSQDGISMIQTAEGALSETHSILQRMRELSVQAANDTLTQQDRGYIQDEVDQLREEITRIGNTTQFNKKKLLNGDAAVLWSSDNLETKAVINGGLRTIDQFGQKSSAEGNYKITVKATPGQGEVQKTDIMRLKHDVSPWYAKIDSTKGVAEATLQKSPDIKGGGVYSVQATMPDADVAASSNLTSQVGGVAFNTVGTVDGTNANVKFTVKDVNTTVGSESITFEVTGQTIGKDGTVADLSKQTLTYKAGTLTNNVSVDGNDVAFTWTGDIANIASRTQKGDEMVYNLTAKAVKDDGDVTITVKGSPESGVMQDHKYVINKNQTRDKELEFKVSYVETDKDNPDLKEVQDG
ncbi:MAG: flagellin, partial [Fretibacterium sp.]|nr:flagellin [Fretibacterium sp.]